MLSWTYIWNLIVGHIFETSIKCLCFIRSQWNFVCMFFKAFWTQLNKFRRKIYILKSDFILQTCVNFWNLIVGHIFETSVKCLCFIRSQWNFVCMFFKAFWTQLNKFRRKIYILKSDFILQTCVNFWSINSKNEKYTSYYKNYITPKFSVVQKYSFWKLGVKWRIIIYLKLE